MLTKRDGLRRITSGALVLVACTACAQVLAQKKVTDAPTFPQGTEVVTVPYDHPVDFHHLNLLHVRMSINGSAPQNFDVDTGSTGIVVGAISIPNFDGKGAPGDILYSSSGVHEKGVWTTVEITFPDAKMPDGRPVTAHVKVLAVTSVECTGKGVNVAHCAASSTPDPHMLGIGFGRGHDPTFDAQIKNAFVQLDDMVAGKMRRGYVISPAGIQLGLNAESVGTGWVWQKLEPRIDKIPDDYTGPKDWQTAPGTFAVDGKTMPMGTVLIDTGLTNVMLGSADAPHEGDVPPGTPVKISLLGGQLSYEFTVNDAVNPAAPRRTSWINPTHGTSINTGSRALALYDYCFDSDGGYLGLRVRK